MKLTFFATPEDFRAWLEAHHARETELYVGFYKKGSGRPSISWPQSVDEALCHGWIDGVRRSVSEEVYSIRFTPRKAKSIWSAVNVARVDALTREGRMKPAGLRAFATRSEARTGVYSFEQKDAAALTPEHEKLLRADRKAGAYFDAQAPWYRRAAIHHVTSARRDETRARRMAQLIEACAAGRPVDHLRPRPGVGAKKKRVAK